MLEKQRTPFPSATGRTAVTELRQALAVGELDIPLPGGGATADRWAVLTRWGRRDAVFGRLAEGHVDAAAILAEAGRKLVPDALYGVWAARSAGTGAILNGQSLNGTVRFCSGAHFVDRALVAAIRDGHSVLVEIELTDDRVEPVEGTWLPYGMNASDSNDIQLNSVPVTEDMIVGPPGFYLERPGFWMGGAGVAAVWLGVATGVVDATVDCLAQGREPDDHQFAHLGALHTTLSSAQALMDQAAAGIDAHPQENHRMLAGTCRAAVETAVREVLDRVPRITGPTPLCRDASFGQRLADLLVYVRQHHAERDLAALGRDVFERQEAK